MKQRGRKEIESSLHGLVVKRFNHYLYKQSLTCKKVSDLLGEHSVDQGQLEQRLRICAKNLDAATRSDKSNEWATEGLEKFKLANELIYQASFLTPAVRCELADSLANFARYELNLYILLEGFGSLGKVPQSCREQSVVDVLLISSNTLNTSPGNHKDEVSAFMDRAKLLNWIAQSKHLSAFDHMWSIAVRASVLTLSTFLESDHEASTFVMDKISEQLSILKEYERGIVNANC